MALQVANVQSVLLIIYSWEQRNITQDFGPYLHLLMGKLQLNELPIPYSRAKVRFCFLDSCFPL